MTEPRDTGDRDTSDRDTGDAPAGGLESLAGVIIETPAGRRFVPAENALMALDSPRLSPLPGTRLELLWFEGRVVPAAAWSVLTEEPGAAPRTRRDGTSRKLAGERSALVCEHGGQLLALTGVELVASGRFSRATSSDEPTRAVIHGSETILAADLAELFGAAVTLTRGPDESRDEAQNTGDSEKRSSAPEDPT
jgi:hypothetical protein